MKCPKCGYHDITIPSYTGQADWPFVECGACGHRWPWLSPAVKRAFAAYERALTAWACADEDGKFASLCFARKQSATARRARDKAEGKGEKHDA